MIEFPDCDIIGYLSLRMHKTISNLNWQGFFFFFLIEVFFPQQTSLSHGSNFTVHNWPGPLLWDRIFTDVITTNLKVKSFWI